MEAGDNTQGAGFFLQGIQVQHDLNAFIVQFIQRPCAVRVPVVDRTTSIQPAHAFRAQIDKIFADQILHGQINAIIFDQFE